MRFARYRHDDKLRGRPLIVDNGVHSTYRAGTTRVAKHNTSTAACMSWRSAPERMRTRAHAVLTQLLIHGQRSSRIYCYRSGPCGQQWPSHRVRTIFFGVIRTRGEYRTIFGGEYNVILGSDGQSCSIESGSGVHEFPCAQWHRGCNDITAAQP